MSYRSTMWTLQRISLLAIVAVVLADDIVVIRQGRLQGHRFRSRRERDIIAFQGIPYAKPPVGELRFKSPQSPDSWTGTKEALSEGPVCVQRGVFPSDVDIRGDEDCLYLNVYTPQLPKGDSGPYPVMFWIHGGGFISGSGSSLMFGPHYLLDKDVVLVTINYRLGALGFLSTEDETCPGNNGFKDQVAALKWVKENIAAFGGNPNSVTIFGESAGSMSVQMLMLSPVAKGLFHGAISQSGTVTNSFSVTEHNFAKEISKELANIHNCTTDSSLELIECLREVSAYDIIASDVILAKPGTLTLFPPVLEEPSPDAVITELPFNTLTSSSRLHLVPWMVGICSSEGGIFKFLSGDVAQLEDIPFIPVFFNKSTDKSIIRDTTRKIQRFYFKGEAIDHEMFQAQIDLFTDMFFLHSTHISVKLHSQKSTAPVFYYYFDYKGTNSFSGLFGNDPSLISGPVHLDELLYLFPQDKLFPDSNSTPQDEQMIDIMTTLWTNFARTRNPTSKNTPESGRWNHVTSEDALEYAHIGDHGLHMRKGLLKDRTDFWDSLPLKTQYRPVYKDEL